MLRSSKRYRQRLSALSTTSPNSLIIARLNIRPTNIAPSAHVDSRAITATMRRYATASTASRAALVQTNLPATRSTKSPRYSRLRTPSSTSPSPLPQTPPLPPHLSKLFAPTPTLQTKTRKQQPSQPLDEPLSSMPLAMGLGVPRREYSDYLEAMEIWEEMGRMKKEMGLRGDDRTSGARGYTAAAGIAVDQNVEAQIAGAAGLEKRIAIGGEGKGRKRLPSIADLSTFIRRPVPVEEGPADVETLSAGRKKKEAGGGRQEEEGKVKKIGAKRGAKVKAKATETPVDTPSQPSDPSPPTPPTPTPTSSPPPLRRNPAGVQLLSPSLHSQIFPGPAPPPPPKSVINISLAHLADNDLSPSGAAVLPEINFELPKLRGANVREHFWTLGEEVAEPWLGMAREFAGMGQGGDEVAGGVGLDVELPELPKEWVVDQPGWVKYPKGDGGAASWERVKDLGVREGE